MSVPSSWLFLACVLGFAGCALDPDNEAPTGSLVETSDSALPDAPGLDGAWWEEVSDRLANDLRVIQPLGQGVYRAGLPALEAHGRLDDQGLRLYTSGSEMSLRFVAWGREGDVQEVDSVEPALGDCAIGGDEDTLGHCLRRLEYQRPGVVEWWANRSAGLQQAWSLDEAPDGEGVLRLEVTVDGADLDVSDAGDQVRLTDAEGQEWWYSDLYAWDALGEPLAALMEVERDRIVIVVDDTNAVYPLTVDPVLSTATSVLTGPDVSNYFGFAVTMGDFNGDGRSDVAVGAKGFNSNRGKVFVHVSSSSNPGIVPYTIPTTATCSIQGGGASNLYASAVAAGDVDGDGKADLVVGAPGVSTNRGSVYVYLGTSTCVNTSANATLTPVAGASQFFGAAVATPNVNGDTYADVAAGAYGTGTSKGSFYVFPGSSTGVTTTACLTVSSAVATEYLGAAIANAGRVNSDTYDDIIVGGYGANTNKGRAYLYNGNATCSSIVLSTTLDGAANSDRFGFAVGAANVNGDAYSDLLVGAPYVTSNTGKVYIYHGTSTGVANAAAANTTLTGSSGSYFGSAVAGAGNVNGDLNGSTAIGDIIIGAPGVSSAAGAAYVYLGTTTGISSSATPTSTLTGAAAGVGFGSAAASGNVNGDSYSDVIVGAPAYSTNTGRAYVYHGYMDADADGYNVGGSGSNQDCNDANAAINPGATEIVADGVDQNCDLAELCYADADNDTYRSSTTVVSTDVDCLDSGEAVTADPTGECNDANAAIHPGATEITGDSTDQDCNGTESCWANADGDGYRTSTAISSIDTDCLDAGEALTTLPANDCNDTSSSINPGATEVAGDQVDQDCTGTELCYIDADNDNYRINTTIVSSDVDCIDSGEALGTDPANDCNDAAVAINPGATEVVADGIDQNCDGTELCYADVDNDGYRTSTTLTSPNASCLDNGEALSTDPAGDCADTNAAIRPNATEIAGDAIDQNCDGAELCWTNADADGYRTSTTVNSTDSDCSDAGEALTTLPANDCNDGSASINPGATELAGDQVDQDCTGTELCYVNADNDGYRLTSTMVSSDVDCLDGGEAITSLPSGDCLDTDPDAYPGALELCGDGIDQDCNGSDPTCPVIEWCNIQSPSSLAIMTNASTGNIFGQVYSTGVTPPVGQGAGIQAQVGYGPRDSDPASTGWIWVNGAYNVDYFSNDEYDATFTVSVPGYYAFAWRFTGNRGIAWTYCDTGGSAYSDPYRIADQGILTVGTDADSDGYFAVASGGTDCDDTNAAIHPGVAETVADGVDYNCDGAETCYADFDVDGFRVDTYIESTDPDCSDAGEALLSMTSGDCDDSDAMVNPAAPEITGDGVDETCDGTEVCFLDFDNDGYHTAGIVNSSDVDCTDGGEALSSEPGGDCNDWSITVSPGVPEGIGDGLDQNCDNVELCYVNSDGDAYRTNNTVVSVDLDCGGTGEAWAYVPSGDCADSDAGIYPGATEIPGDQVDQDCTGTEICYADADGDTYRTSATVVSSDTDCVDVGEALASATPGDCDDQSAAIRPNATEIVADGVDQNCDGLETCYVDADNDGYRLSTTIASADSDCSDSGEGLASDPTGDCNDANSTIHTGATEIVGSGLDESCDGIEICYVDADNDNYRLTTTVNSSDTDCLDNGEALASEPSGDCNDALSTINPGASESVADGVDQNCDGQEICYVDADSDGYRLNSTLISSDTDCTDSGEGIYSDPIGDCDDTNGAAYPGATEIVANDADENCDGQEVCYRDADNDNYRLTSYVISTDTDCADSGEALATDPSGDCNDANASVNPGATEIVGDNADQNCDGRETCYTDVDNDTYRLTTTRSSSDTDCLDSGEALATDPTGDCDDTRATVFPGAPEVAADGIDQDCDGTESCFVDADDDGYRTTGTILSTDGDCSDAGEAITNDPTGDCDDLTAAINPGAIETCDAFLTDEDCDGTADDGDSSVQGRLRYYPDVDDDGYGSSSSAGSLRCHADGTWELQDHTDCNDTNAGINPAAVDVVGDGLDGNCDGGEICYIDLDQDGYRANLDTVVSTDLDCTDPGEATNLSQGGDCDDRNAAVNPGRPEVCDAADLDEDCDGTADNDDWSASGLQRFYPDSDADGHGDMDSLGRDLCDPSEDFRVTDHTDCDDALLAIHPGATEIVGDDVDQDCDGEELCFMDLDDDGYRPDATTTVNSADMDCADSGEALSVEPLGDCNDYDAAFHPGASEANCTDPNDYNCDGSTAFADSDGDGWAACRDCNDHDALINPTATELPGDAVDQDCTGTELCHADADGDGYRPDAASTVFSADLDCVDPGEALANAPLGDCDDLVVTTNPGMSEICDSADVDEDCDGLADDGDNSALLQIRWYLDADGDGYGDMDDPGLDLCDAVGSRDVTSATDCDDAAADVRPGAFDSLGSGRDEDCDGFELCYLDADGDGFRPDDRSVVSADGLCTGPGEALSSVGTGDCVDTDSAWHPGAIEDDCTDPNDYDCDGIVAWADADNDGHAACEDCDDSDADIWPGAVEVTGDGIDENCDGIEICFVDGDGDGFRPDASSTRASLDSDCFDLGEALNSLPTGDCDDTVGAISPGGIEVCDALDVDEDCDGGSDDADMNGASDARTWYPDADMDTYGDSSSQGRTQCDPDSTWIVAVQGDCDDSNPAFHDGAAELDCTDPNDYDCDGVVAWADADADGWPACTECDDTDSATHPGAIEVEVDGLDQDCDGGDLCFVDSDGDGHGTKTSLTGIDLSCTGSGESLVSDDCDDTDASAFPGAKEIPYDGVDQDCSGADINDQDGDGYLGLAAGGDDCDDQVASTHPGAGEIAYDGVDQDCSGADLTDVDGDGYDAEEAGGDDCDDGSAGVHPGADDPTSDGVDQDCDGTDGPVDTDDTDTDDTDTDDTDTDDTDDVGPDSTGDTGGSKPVEPGCGCVSNGGRGAGLGLILVGILAMRRRREMAA